MHVVFMILLLFVDLWELPKAIFFAHDILPKYLCPTISLLGICTSVFVALGMRSTLGQSPVKCQRQ